MLPKLHASSIRIKVILWSFFPTLVILVGVAWFTFYAYQKVTVELTLRQDLEQVQLLAQQVNNDLGAGLNPYFTSLLFDQEFIRLSPEQQRSAVIASQHLAGAFDGGWLVFTEQGVVESTQPHRPDLVGQDWSEDSLVQLALQNLGSGYFSNILPLGPEGEPVILVAISIMNKQPGYSAVLVGMLRISTDPATTLNRIFSSMNTGRMVYLVDSYGRVIYHPDLSLVGQDLSGSAGVAQALLGQAQRQTFNRDGNAVAISHTTVLRNGEWRLIKEQPLNELMQPSLPYTLMLLGLLALGVIIPSIFVSFGLRRIVQPILQLTAATQDVAGGNFSRKIHVSSNDELAELAEQFNRMSDELQASYSLLEKRVSDRTRELATLNAISSVISRSLDLEEILSSALDQTLLAVQMQTGAAYRFSEGDGLQRVVQRGLSPEFYDQLAGWSELSKSMGETSPPAICLEPGNLPEHTLQAALLEAGVCLLVLVWLRTKGKTLGLLCLCAASVRVVSAEELTLLQSIAEQVAVALENARLYEKAEETAVSEERSRLARDLHDAVTQTLFAASLIAEALPQIYDANPDLTKQKLGELRNMTRGALAEMRTLLLELRPGALAEERLENLLRQLAEAVTGRTGLPVELNLRATGRLPAAVQTAFYRIAQEALNNIVKHACATHVTVSLQLENGAAVMAVEDNGVGFSPRLVQGGHLGVSIMRERAAALGGIFSLTSSPGAGARVEVSWPAPNQEDG